MAEAPCCAAYQATLSSFDVSQRSPTDHCAMPRPGPPPYCAMVGDMPDSWSRLPRMPAACTSVRPLPTKNSKATLSLAVSETT